VNLKAFLAAVRMYWKTFAVVTVTVLALVVTWLVLTPIRYVSTTQLLVAIRGSTTAAAYQNDAVVSGRVSSYIALLTSDVVSQRVVDDLRLQMTARELAAKVSATDVPPKTSIIDVAVTDESPEQAQRIADTLGREFISYTNALETPTGEDGQKVQTSVVTAASEPHSRLAQYVALGVLAALAALLLGAVAVWIRSLTDRVVRTANRAAAAAGVPVLGCVTAASTDSTAIDSRHRRWPRVGDGVGGRRRRCDDGCVQPWTCPGVCRAPLDRARRRHGQRAGQGTW
jgi:capsular polysaccharide biosynthesis protein